MDLSLDSNDRVMNGGIFFNDINASLENNETYSKPIHPQIGDCAV